MCPMCPMKWIGYAVELSGGHGPDRDRRHCTQLLDCLRATLLAVDAVDAVDS